jgi:hypothetical protein
MRVPSAVVMPVAAQDEQVGVGASGREDVGWAALHRLGGFVSRGPRRKRRREAR